MSDLNLPIVTYDSWGVQEFITETVVGTYALVPVEQMEKVWWCRVHESPEAERGEYGCAYAEAWNPSDPCYMQVRWLVSAEGAER